MPQFLRALVLVGTQLFVLVRQHLHESMHCIRQVEHMPNASLCANLVAAELPEPLLLVVIRLNAPAELVEAERVERHGLGAGTAKRLAFLPGNAHVQGHRIHGAEKEAVRAAPAQRHIGMDGAVTEDARLYQAVGDEIVVHPVAVIRDVIGNLIQGQTLAVLRRTAAAACRRSGQIKQRRISYVILFCLKSCKLLYIRL